MPDRAVGVESIGPADVDPVTGDDALMQFLYRAPIGLLQTTLDGTVEMINPKSAQLLMPISRSGSLDNLFVVLRDVAPQLPAMVRDFPSASGSICESLRVTVEGIANVPPRILSIDLTKLDASRLLGVISDATVEVERERHELARQLRHAARVDVLTSMPNRVALLERVRQLIELEPIDAGHAFAVLFMNCDRFSLVNDRFGHPVGDELLALMAGRLRSVLPPPDASRGGVAFEQMAARVSGDEFVLIVEGVDDGAAEPLARRVLDLLAKPYTIGDQQLYCGVSIGIVTRAHATGDADLLLQDASIAMDEAKRNGGARHAVFDAAMRLRTTLRSGLEAELRQALSNDELFVVYQPVVGLNGANGFDAGAGVEALIRWRHPIRGVVPPVEFIPMAEETGLIGALGDFVLKTACRQFVAWQVALGSLAPRTLAVNLSRAQLGAADLIPSVERILIDTGMTPGRLQLEVTESFAAQDERIQARLHDLKALGLTLALDDFGTGYSSLSSLHLLPVDTVKIDRSFVSLVDTSAYHRVLVEATVRVARSLGMTTVAEGIETQQQAAMVRDLGCDKGQGYLFSRPLTVEEVKDWLSWPPRVATGFSLTADSAARPAEARAASTSSNAASAISAPAIATAG